MTLDPLRASLLAGTAAALLFTALPASAQTPEATAGGPYAGGPAASSPGGTAGGAPGAAFEFDPGPETPDSPVGGEPVIINPPVVDEDR